MQNNKVTVLKETHPPYIEAINGHKFTPREMDIVACVLSGKAIKTIAAFLSISPKTVEAHIHNIMLKLECNSREGIINFIESSGQFSWFRKRYQDLLYRSHFEQQLQKISLLTRKKNLVCRIVDGREHKDKTAFIHQLEKHLERAGIKIAHGDKESSEALHTLHFVFDLVTKPYQDNTTYLLMDRNAATTPFLEACDRGYVDFREQKNYYFSVFDVLKRVFPDLAFEEIIADFKTQQDSPSEQTTPFLWLKTKELIQKKDRFQRLWAQAHRNNIIIGGILFLCALSFMLEQTIRHSHDPHPHDPHQVRSDLPLPIETAFLKRPALVARIIQQLKGDDDIQIVALVGVGGTGKTTLARSVGRSRDASVVWEINAETKDKIINSFKDLAYVLAQTTEQKEELNFIQKIQNAVEKEKRTLTFVKRGLAENENWFLIYNNVETFSDIKSYFPHDPKTWGRGKVIITTRDDNIKNTSYIKPENVIQMESLGQEEVLTLFSKILYESNAEELTLGQKEKALNFLQNIPPFPLDISIAAYYIKNTQVTYEQYLERIAQDRSQFESIQENLLRETNDYTNTRYAIITMALKKIVEEHPDFQELLLFISVIDSQKICKDLLACNKKSSVIEEFIHALKKHSLVLRENDETIFSVHKSTQEISLAYFIKTLNLAKKDNQFIQSIASSLKKYIVRITEREDHSRMRLLVNHCEMFLSHSLLTEAERGEFEGELGRLYYHLSDYTKAKYALEASLANLNKQQDDKYPLLAQTWGHLGEVYRRLGDYEMAKTLLEQSLLVYKKHLPENYVGMTQALGRLGNFYRRVGDHKKAKDLLEQSLLICEEHLPENYTAIGMALGYLGIVYREMGDYEKAKDFLEQSLINHGKYFPEDHVRIAWVWMFLGSVHAERGEYEKAKTLLEQSLAVYQKNLPENYANVVWVLTYLGGVHSELGDYEKAKDLLEQGLANHKKYLPEDHVDIAVISLMLGNVFRKRGDYEKAKDLLEQSLIIYRKHFREDHTEVAWALANLGAVYRELGDYSKAKSLFEKALSVYEKNYGEDHIETARILRELGQVYLLEGDIKTAENLMNRALKSFQHSEHSESYLCLESLANLYLRSMQTVSKKDAREAGNIKNQAIAYLKQALAIVMNRFPAHSPHSERLRLKLKEIE